MIKPAGPDCNLACEYCFYACKEGLFGAGRHRMSEATLERLVRDYQGLGFPMYSYAWQGGEPTLMGLDFYRRAVELQREHLVEGSEFQNGLQTNSVLLDDEWCRFLTANDFLVGISLDGPRELHDVYRLNKGGHGTWEQVMASIGRCRTHDTQFNILVLLNDRNVKEPDLLWDFFREQDFRYLQFIPCVEWDERTGEMAPFAVTAEEYGGFLCRIFDRWLEHGPGEVSVRLFDSVVSHLVQGIETECTFGRRCAQYVVVEHTGEVYCCDFYVDPQWRLGNLHETNIGELSRSPVKGDFARRKRRLPTKCQVCRYLQMCYGGCPKDRRVMQTGPGAGASYLCEAYRMFYDHALAQLRVIAAQVQAGRR